PRSPSHLDHPSPCRIHPLPSLPTTRSRPDFLQPNPTAPPVPTRLCPARVDLPTQSSSHITPHRPPSPSPCPVTPHRLPPPSLYPIGPFPPRLSAPSRPATSLLTKTPPLPRPPPPHPPPKTRTHPVPSPPAHPPKAPPPNPD